ncbi:hypothetical protein ZIOFF_063600 [Zingiber officinale]|uniref:AMP-dependent synthetase/ligase domain-containing protein n=1 Tax=Zingiber officinale TaxID=94328 RepID=A0A8J5F6L1_ZINOF|nr:hypothetical protein ZIOFF_063600 [Zingiber officinale]
MDWSSAVEIWFLGQGLSDHLETQVAEHDDASKAEWQRVDYQLVSLLWQSIDPSLLVHYRSYKSCYDIWKKAKSVYANDIQRLYDSVHNLATLQMQDHDLTSVKNQVLTNPNIPTVDELIDRLVRVPLTDGSLKTEVDSAILFTNSDRGGRGRGRGRGGRGNRPQCSHCNRIGHTRDRCFTLHGFPAKSANMSQVQVVDSAKKDESLQENNFIASQNGMVSIPNYADILQTSEYVEAYGEITLDCSIQKQIASASGGKVLTNRLIREPLVISMLDWLWAGIIVVLLWPLHKLGVKLVYSKIHCSIGISKAGISGGASLPLHIDRFFEAIGIKVQNGYGLTETSPVVAARRPSCNVLGTIGHPLQYTEMKIVDAETGEVLPDGSKGVVKVKGPQVMAGYYKHLIPQQSESFAPSPQQRILLPQAQACQMTAVPSSIDNGITPLGCQNNKDLTFFSLPDIKFYNVLLLCLSLAALGTPADCNGRKAVVQCRPLIAVSARRPYRSPVACGRSEVVVQGRLLLSASSRQTCRSPATHNGRETVVQGCSLLVASARRSCRSPLLVVIARRPCTSTLKGSCRAGGGAVLPERSRRLHSAACDSRETDLSMLCVTNALDGDAKLAFVTEGLGIARDSVGGHLRRRSVLVADTPPATFLFLRWRHWAQTFGVISRFCSDGTPWVPISPRISLP